MSNAQKAVQAPRKPRRFSLRQAMFVLPNLFTLSSLFCGLFAITLAYQINAPKGLYRATLAIFFGAFFDMADGRIARLTKTQSQFGVQLDSLADLVTFGVAPAIIAHRWFVGELGLAGKLLAFAYVGCAALRLARFNVLAARAQGGPTDFIGMPVPLAAGILSASILCLQRHGTAFPQVSLATLAGVLLFLLSALMVSNIRYRAFKSLRLRGKTAMLVLALWLGFAVLAWAFGPAIAVLVFLGSYSLEGIAETCWRALMRSPQNS